ncbi:hypothetical protein A3A39_03165 [Candidatus Kaiserbacteria bacterium RIFCSPLOWO2_01_FULL_54_13]|uniref:Uncharacterized protein n=1 Tax=Candidatus Kaiserbacteria bacterium RIFCSPLOWO2_01_FULL_54_13 TaxID=1798512 RepID=A0A1F6F462_9BACT|nr:MAG: hypothetical protein A3A39_03165 [Candidatus Kaiserbacteria bacterium RIFCSPLOWO2_01_FULL_54_13]
MPSGTGIPAGATITYTETDRWEKLGYQSIWAFTAAIIVMLGLPGNIGQAHPLFDFIHTFLAYGFALVCLGYLGVNAKMIKERDTDPLKTLDMGMKDYSRSQWPWYALIAIVVGKPLLYAGFMGIWNPFVWFAPWQWLAGVAAFATVYFDVIILSWLGFRITQLQNELTVERSRR